MTDSSPSLPRLRANRSFSKLSDLVTDRTASLVSWLVLAGGLATMVFTAVIVIVSYSSLPSVDHLAFLYQVGHGKTDMWDLGASSKPANLLRILWAQHNGHRIIFSKLLILMDVALFGGKGILLLVSSYFLQVFQLFVFGYLLVKFGTASKYAIRSALGAAAFCLFGLAQREVFTTSFEVGNVLSFACATSAFASLTLIDPQQETSIWTWTILAWISAFVGSYSMMSGFLIWPVLLAGIIALRLPKKILLATLAVSLVAAGLNLIAYHAISLNSNGLLANSSGPLLFFIQLMATAWQNIGYTIGEVLACVGTVASVGTLLRQMVLREPSKRLQIFLTCTNVYIVLTILLISFTRWNEGFTERYEEGVLIFWCAYAVAFYGFIEHQWAGRGLVALQLLTCLVMAYSGNQIRPLMAQAKERKVLFHVAAAAIATKVYDPTVLLTSGIPEWSIGNIDYLSEHHAALYADGPALLVGGNLKQLNIAASSSCSGAVYQIDLVNSAWPGFTLSGWARDSSTGKRIDHVFFANRKGRIVGLGSAIGSVRSLSLPGQVAEADIKRREATWRGFLPPITRSEPTFVYGLISPGVACLLNAAKPIHMDSSELNKTPGSYPNLSGDVPAVGDFDGDGKLDFAIWRPSNGIWCVIPTGNPTHQIIRQWGILGDIPVAADFDGDGQTDLAVWRPSSGTWYVVPSRNPERPFVQQWGMQGDVPVTGDFDGDGKLDLAVWRPSSGTWYVKPTGNPQSPIVHQWGMLGDIPVPADFDGDKVTDFAVWRPSTGIWYVASSRDPAKPLVNQLGLPGDVPVTGDFDGDGKVDFVVWRPSTGTWYMTASKSPLTPISKQWGFPNDVPVPADVDGDKRTDFIVWRPSDSSWYALPSRNPAIPYIQRLQLGGHKTAP